MAKLHINEKERDIIIFGKHDRKAYIGGMRRFENLSLDALKQLVDLNYINLNEKQNKCPSVREILEFMEKYPDYTTHGYVISAKRNDYRVSLEGVEKKTPAASLEERTDFDKLFKNPDEVVVLNRMYCWYD